jgi:hypothetical protein
MRPFAAAMLLIPFLGSGCEFGYKGISVFSFRNEETNSPL